MTQEPDLSVSVNGKMVLAGPLAYWAACVRYTVGGDPAGQLLPFTYRDPFDPECPDAPRPLRHARLVIEELGIIPEGKSE